MKKINKYMLAIILFITFTFTCMSDVKAAKGYSRDGKCSKYFNVYSVDYNVDEDDYVDGVIYTEQRWGNSIIESDQWTNMSKNNTITYTYVGACGSGGACTGDENFTKEDRLVITIYRSNTWEPYKEICTETIKGFDSNKKGVKLTIKFKTSMWLNVNGVFQEYNDKGKKSGTSIESDGRWNITMKIDDYDFGYKITSQTAPTKESPKLVLKVKAQDKSGWIGLLDTKGVTNTSSCTIDGVEIAETISHSATLFENQVVNSSKYQTGLDITTTVDFSGVKDWDKKTIECNIKYKIKKKSGKVSAVKTYPITLEGQTITESDYGKEEDTVDKNGNSATATTTAPTTTLKGTVAATSIDGIDINGSQEIDCDAGDESLREFISEYWGYFLIGVPVLLIVMITIDFVKALFSSDQDLLSKAVNDAVKRTLAAILLLVLPIIISTILGFFGIDLCI